MAGFKTDYLKGSYFCKKKNYIYIYTFRGLLPSANSTSTIPSVAG